MTWPWSAGRAGGSGGTWGFGIAGTAAAVAALLLGTQFLTTGSGRRAGPGPQHPTRAAPPTVVPWAPLPPTHPKIATRTVPPSPDPAAARAVSPCQASDLQVTQERGVASSTAYLLLRVRARDAVRCSLAGVPRLQLSHGPGEPTISVREARDESTYQAGPVLVTTRRAAVLKLAWSGHGCTTQPVHNGELQVSLGDGLGTLQTSGFGRMSACRARSGSGLDAVTERPFEPQTWRRGYSRSPLAEVDPGDSLGRVAARPGSTTRFTVTLTAPHDIPLDPCPDYVIGLAGQGVHAQARHALNCGAVPYRDAQGRPLLPGGTPLRFAMQVEAPQHDVPKLTWWLVEPSGRVGVTGRLVVGGPGAP